MIDRAGGGSYEVVRRMCDSSEDEDRETGHRARAAFRVESTSANFTRRALAQAWRDVMATRTYTLTEWILLVKFKNQEAFSTTSRRQWLLLSLHTLRSHLCSLQ